MTGDGKDPAPSPPDITTRDLLRQFWRDVYGKEVQSASTYSYTWMADQLGHICIGILADFLATFAVGRWMYGADATYRDGSLGGLLITVAAVSLWELSAYRSSVTQATAVFVLDKKLLRDNAIIAAVYMALGGVVGFAFHQIAAYAFPIAFGVLGVAIILAPRWLRQKIIWQKAGLPYLFRLADAVPTISTDGARELQKFIDAPTPPEVSARQVIIGGPVGSGRTSLATGLGTEFAFKGHKVRYVGFASLLEFASDVTPGRYPDDSGPANIGYWPWSEAQLVVIDDIGPEMVDPLQTAPNIERLSNLLGRSLQPIRNVLAQRHTVWIVGDHFDFQPAGSGLNDIAKLIKEYCSSSEPTLLIELSAAPPEPPLPKGTVSVKQVNVRRIEKAQ